MKQAVFLFTCDSLREAQIVEQSLSPEIQQKIPKSTVNLTRDKKNLKLIIQSSDMSSLRAACNSYLRWIHTAVSVEHVV
ncbi:MAG: KEOPS complex subunit Pcc1 [Methanobacteriota archaeon]